MYYTIQENNLLISETEQALTRYYGNVLPLPIDYEKDKYIVVEGELVLNPNFEAEKEEKKQQEIAMLSLTSADVERGIYKATGKDFDDVVALVVQLKEAQDERVANLDLKALKIELKANNFYRGNPYVDAVGSLLGFTKEQLDEFFADGNYEHLLEVTDEGL